jgi:two-component system response regulator YesN
MISNHNIIKVLNIIKTRYDEELSLEDIAEEIGVHKVYLSRLFKKEVGRNYYDYLQSYRIRKAELLLGEEKLKMYEVAKRSGFNNYDQFAVVFKKLNGTSPSEYRKKLTDQ